MQIVRVAEHAVAQAGNAQKGAIEKAHHCITVIRAAIVSKYLIYSICQLRIVCGADVLEKFEYRM